MYVCTASIFRVTSQKIQPQFQCLSTKQHGITLQKSVVLISISGKFKSHVQNYAQDIQGHISAMHLKFPSYNKYNMAADKILMCEHKYKFYTKRRSNCFS